MTLASPTDGPESRAATANHEWLSIGELAQTSGHTTVTLRHWERVGLLEPPPRSGGKRRFPRSALDRIRLIDLARAAGFRLIEIRELLTDRQPPMAPGDRWRSLAARKCAELDAQAAAVAAMRDVLEHLVDCRCVSLDECAARAATDATRDFPLHLNTPSRDGTGWDQ